MGNSNDMAAMPALATQSKFLSMQPARPRYSMQPVRASMPHREEEPESASPAHEGRREIMAKFARAGAAAATAVALKDRYALADEEEAEEPKPGAGKRFDGSKLGAIAAVPALAVGWVGFNILGPAFDQFGFMQEEKERKSSAVGGKKKRR